MQKAALALLLVTACGEDIRLGNLPLSLDAGSDAGMSDAGDSDASTPADPPDPGAYELLFDEGMPPRCNNLSIPLPDDVRDPNYSGLFPGWIELARADDEVRWSGPSIEASFGESVFVLPRRSPEEPEFDGTSVQVRALSGGFERAQVYVEIDASAPPRVSGTASAQLVEQEGPGVCSVRYPLLLVP